MVDIGYLRVEKKQGEKGKKRVKKTHQTPLPLGPAGKKKSVVPRQASSLGTLSSAVGADSDDGFSPRFPVA